MIWRFITHPTRAAILAMVVALSGTYLFARTVEQRALQNSHQLPTPPDWFEPAPVKDQATLQQGRRLFMKSCAHCHGIDAEGDEGPDLHDLQVSDRYISNMIRHGIKGEMPSFAKKHTTEDIRMLIAYLRTLE
jgi:mono/diheme cytochrome c family protein